MPVVKPNVIGLIHIKSSKHFRSTDIPTSGFQRDLLSIAASRKLIQLPFNRMGLSLRPRIANPLVYADLPRLSADLNTELGWLLRKMGKQRP
ncbi:MAG: hypothetical protein IH991_24025 [Planctomycetes bacterium]|nr:hypothetical protein [Planctomycetota bacterium]